MAFRSIVYSQVTLINIGTDLFHLTVLMVLICMECDVLSSVTGCQIESKP